MKNFSILSITFLILSLVASCGPKPEEQVKEFAVKFGDFVNTNQKDSVQKYYPEFTLSDSLVNVGVSGISVNQIANGETYTIEYSPETSLIVKRDNEGNIIVEESKGLIAFSPDQKELLRKSDRWEDDLTDIEISKLLAEENEKRNSFTSPDLDFFNLHGPVKEMTVISSPKDSSSSWYLWGYKEGWASSNNYTFDKDGVWTNYKNFNIIKIKRDNEGKIISLHEPDDEVDPTVMRYTWDGNKLSKVRYDWSTYDGWENARFKYDKQFIVEEKGVYSNTSDEVSYVTTFKDFQTDELGNWTNCTWTKATTQPDYDSDAERNKTTYSSGNITRKITYY